MDDVLISRQKLKDAMYHEAFEKDSDDQKWDSGCWIRYRMFERIINSQPSAQQWIPVITRPMDEEERKIFSEKLGFDVEYTDPVIFECKMPDDGQEILVSYNGYISMDKCEVDEDCYYGLEGNGDWYGVIAWMPLPEPYKGGDHG